MLPAIMMISVKKEKAAVAQIVLVCRMAVQTVPTVIIMRLPKKVNVYQIVFQENPCAATVPVQRIAILLTAAMPDVSL